MQYKVGLFNFQNPISPESLFFPQALLENFISLYFFSTLFDISHKGEIIVIQVE